MTDSSILAILISAFGGAVISAFTGFLTIYINNKHSFRMAKEKDKYEYVQYTNRMLYKYLNELERECYIATQADSSETLRRADDISENVQQVYVLVKPFLDDDIINRLDTLSDETKKHKSILFQRGLSAIDKNNVQYDINELNTWYSSLSEFRNDLSSSIQAELRRIKNNRK